MEKSICLASFLPHRKPLLMVDAILEIDSQKVTCEYWIDENGLFIENGHLQEAGLIENAAQTCSCVVGQEYFVQDPYQQILGFISSITRLSIYQLPKVQSSLRTQATLLSKLKMGDGYLCKMNCFISQAQNTLLEAEINLLMKNV